MQPNAGAHATLNRLVALADDCEYLAILNSDDCYHPRRIERCLEYLECPPGSRICVCTRLRLIDEAGAHPARRRAPRAMVLGGVEFRRRRRRRQPARPRRMARAGQLPRHDEQFFRPRELSARPAVCGLPVRARLPRAASSPRWKTGWRSSTPNCSITASTPPTRFPPNPNGSSARCCGVNLDLARELGPRLAAEPALRAAFTRYQRAAWSNVSAFRADLFNLVLTEALTPAAHAGGGRAARRDSTPNGFPRSRNFPTAPSSTRTIPSARAGADGRAGGQVLRAQGAAFRRPRQRAAVGGIPAAASGVAGSRWFALGRLLGLVRPITKAGGKTGEEKLSILRGRVSRSPWLRLGESWGFRPPPGWWS